MPSRASSRRRASRADGETPPAGPGPDERVNVLVLGVDAAPGRSAVLTDTMMVVSFDPVGKTASMVSLPRDLVNVPLGGGDDFGPKLNSLMSYADRHPKDFPKGGLRTLQGAIGELLGIPIHYHATMEFEGFIDMVDAVGGVDITVAKAIDDPGYDGFGADGRGWSITKGRHHLDGVDALAYARSRKSAGESDFTRAGRQQQIIVALKDAATDGGSIFWELPGLIGAVGDSIRTDLPIERLPAAGRVDRRDARWRHHPSHHPPPAGPLGRHPLWVVTDARPAGHPRRRGQALPDAGHRPGTLADARAVVGPSVPAVS